MKELGSSGGFIPFIGLYANHNYLFSNVKYGVNQFYWPIMAGGDTGPLRHHFFGAGIALLCNHNEHGIIYTLGKVLQTCGTAWKRSDKRPALWQAAENIR